MSIYTNVKTKYEIFNDMEPRDFVEQFMKTGENGISFKNIYWLSY